MDITAVIAILLGSNVIVALVSWYANRRKINAEAEGIIADKWEKYSLKLETRIQLLEEKRDVLEKRIAALEEELKNLRIENANLRIQRDDLDRRVHELEDEVKRLRSKLAALNGDGE